MQDLFVPAGFFALLFAASYAAHRLKRRPPLRTALVAGLLVLAGVWLVYFLATDRLVWWLVFFALAGLLAGIGFGALVSFVRETPRDAGPELWQGLSAYAGVGALAILVVSWHKGLEYRWPDFGEGLPGPGETFLVSFLVGGVIGLLVGRR